MVAVTKAAVRQDVRALAQLVDEAVERLPGEQLGALHAVLKGAHNTITALQSPHTTEVGPLPDYFPVVAGERATITARAVREAGTRWDAAAERGQRDWVGAIAALGPLLTPGEVATRLGVSTSTVNNWRGRDKLLALRFDDHQYRYPAFQFAESPANSEQGLVPNLASILALLGERSPWARAQFFLTATPILQGETPLAVLRRGEREAVERVRRLAKQAGEMGT